MTTNMPREIATTDEEKRLFSNFLQYTHDGLILTDAMFNVSLSNTTAEKMFGFSAEEFKEKNLFTTADFYEVQSGKKIPHDGLVRQAESQLFSDATLINHNKDTYTVEITVFPQKEIKGAYIFTFQDTSTLKEMNDKLQFQKTHDLLTGLYNRKELARQIAKALNEVKQNEKKYTVLRIDIDRFKLVNDAYGTEAGDEYLRQTARIIADRTGINDICARIGSDDFIVLLANTEITAAIDISEKLLETMRQHTFIHKEASFPISASIGILSMDDTFIDEHELMIALNEACFSARKKGGNRFALYKSGESSLATRRYMPVWLKKINTALREDNFKLFYQKIAPLGLNSINKIELLIRMIEPDGEIIPPDVFLPAAEQYNMLPDIDRWVVTKAVEIWSQMKKTGNPLIDSVFCVNISGSTVQDDTFIPFLFELFDRTGVPPTSFCFEITETIAITNLVFASRFITLLKEKGFTFALDDFGSGFSSFGYLKNLPVDYLKIDGSFIHDMNDNKVNKTMVEAINSMCHVLGLRTIGEYACNTEILLLLNEIGVDFAQGFAISKPEPLNP